MVRSFIFVTLFVLYLFDFKYVWTFLVKLSTRYYCIVMTLCNVLYIFLLVILSCIY